jgi:putative transposon-encoded protein
MIKPNVNRCKIYVAVAFKKNICYFLSCAKISIPVRMKIGKKLKLKKEIQEICLH